MSAEDEGVIDGQEQVQEYSRDGLASIGSQLERVNARLDVMTTLLADLKTIDAGLQGNINSLSEKVDGNEKLASSKIVAIEKEQSMLMKAVERLTITAVDNSKEITGLKKVVMIVGGILSAGLILVEVIQYNNNRYLEAYVRSEVQEHLARLEDELEAKIENLDALMREEGN